MNGGKKSADLLRALASCLGFNTARNIDRERTQRTNALCNIVRSKAACQERAVHGKSLWQVCGVEGVAGAAGLAGAVSIAHKMIASIKLRMINCRCAFPEAKDFNHAQPATLQREAMLWRFAAMQLRKIDVGTGGNFTHSSWRFINEYAHMLHMREFIPDSRDYGRSGFRSHCAFALRIEDVAQIICT